MIGVAMEIEESGWTALDLIDEMKNIKREILTEDTPRFFRQGRNLPEFPDDESEYIYQLIRGRNGVPKEMTGPQSVNPDTLNIPFSSVYTSGGNAENMIAAARLAYDVMLKRAPYRTGEYAGSISIFVGNRIVRASQLESAGIDADSMLSVAPTAIFSNTLERGFYEDYYQTETLHGGIVLYTTRLIRRELGTKVSIQFEYLQNPNSKGGSYPALRIAAPGVLSGRDARPGAYARKQTARRNRRA